jgi:hypothetical protein
MEGLKLRSTAGVAKLAGVLFCIGGAATLAFYKGPHLKLLGHHQLFGHSTLHDQHAHLPSSKTWIKGCFLFLVSSTFWGLWLVFQVWNLLSSTCLQKPGEVRELKILDVGFPFCNFIVK